MNSLRPKLEWEEKYSVGVLEIDNQHKKLFEVINEIMDVIGGHFEQEKVNQLINKLLEYKKFHFATEKKYFKEFNYEGAAEHVLEHQKFGEKLASLQEKYKDDLVNFSFALIEFLEDWLINHLMNEDQKYKECFASHGLK